MVRSLLIAVPQKSAIVRKSYGSAMPGALSMTINDVPFIVVAIQWCHTHSIIWTWLCPSFSAACTAFCNLFAAVAGDCCASSINFACSVMIDGLIIIHRRVHWSKSTFDQEPRAVHSMESGKGCSPPDRLILFKRLVTSLKGINLLRGNAS